MLTGGADGIGRECALAYAREGATVAILDRDLETARQHRIGSRRRHASFHADVSDGEATRAAIDAVLGRFGRIDAVHNNAGIASPSKPLHETTEQEWDDLLRVNVKSVFWTTRFAFEALAAEQGSHPEYRQHGGTRRASEPCGLCGNQGRDDLADQGHGCRLRPLRDPRECGVPRWSMDADAGEVVRRASRTRQASGSISTIFTCSGRVRTGM